MANNNHTAAIVPNENEVSELYDTIMEQIDPELTSNNLPAFRTRFESLSSGEQGKVMRKKAQSLKRYEKKIDTLTLDYRNYLRTYYVTFLKDAETHYNKHEIEEILKKLDDELKNL